MFSQFFVFSLDWNFWSSKYMKRDLYDNFFENTELLGKTLEKRFAGEYKLKKENKEKIGGEFVQLKDSNLARGFLFFDKHRHCTVPWYFCGVLTLQIKKGRVWLTIFYGSISPGRGKWSKCGIFSFFWSSAVTKRFDFFFNFSQLFWRDFSRGILKIFLFWS